MTQERDEQMGRRQAAGQRETAHDEKASERTSTLRPHRGVARSYKEKGTPEARPKNGAEGRANGRALSDAGFSPAPKPQSKPKARPKPLPRSTKPLKRTALPARTSLLPKATKPIKKRGRSRFPKRRDPHFLAWIREQPCCITGLRTGAWLRTKHGWVQIHVDPSHVQSRGAGGNDRGNVNPLARHLHDEYDGRGHDTFEAKYGVDMAALALTYDQRYTDTREAA